jgi:hypothetical protein
MKRASKIAVAMAVPAILLCLVSLQLMCQGGSAPPKDDQSLTSAAVTAKSATTLPAGPTSVRVCIMMVVHKEYGLLAQVSGNKDITVTDRPYAAGKSWWDNPMVIFEDPSFPNSAVAAGASAAPISGSGKSSNVSVEMTLVPHADITLKTPASSDCIKGTLTATITTVSDYYDGKWTQVANVSNEPVVFNFDTCDKSKPLRPTASESRIVPPFTFERYIRDHQKWERKTAWPTNPKSGDWRCTIHVKDAKLAVTGYQFMERAPAETRN